MATIFKKTPYITMRGNKISFSGLSHKDGWLLNALGHAWLTNHEWEQVSKLNFKITTKWGGSYQHGKKTINIGAGSSKLRNLLRKNHDEWFGLTKSIIDEITHTVCHELSHAVTAIDEEGLRTGEDSIWLENGLPDNFPHHKYFYKNFKRVCPERLWNIEYATYPKMAKTGMGPSDQEDLVEQDNRNKNSNFFKIGLFEFVILGFLIGFFAENFLAIILIFLNLFLVRKVLTR